MTVPGWPSGSPACLQSWTAAEDQYLLELLARSGPERRCVGPPLADLMAQRFGRAYNHQQIWLRLTQICPANPSPPQSKPSLLLEANYSKRIARVDDGTDAFLRKSSEFDAVLPVEALPGSSPEAEAKSKRITPRSGLPPPRGGSKWRQEEMTALVQFVDSQGKDWVTIADMMTSRFGTRYRRYSHFTVEFKWRYMKRLQPAQFERSSKPSSEGEECEQSSPIRSRCFSESDLPAKKPRTLTAQPIIGQWGEVISARLETVDHFVNRIFATGSEDPYVIEH